MTGRWSCDVCGDPLPTDLGRCPACEDCACQECCNDRHFHPPEDGICPDCTVHYLGYLTITTKETL